MPHLHPVSFQFKELSFLFNLLSASDVIMTTVDALSKLTRSELETLLREVNLSTNGAEKKDLAQRYISFVANESAATAPALTEEAITDTLATAEFGARIGLSAACIEFLLSEELRSVKDIKILGENAQFPQNIVMLKLGDREKLAKFLRPSLYATQGVRQPVGLRFSGNMLPQQEDLRERLQRAQPDSKVTHTSRSPSRENENRRRDGRHTHRRQRSRSSSSSGESDSTIENNLLDELPHQTRELPQPHKFVNPRGKAGGKKKLVAADLSCNDLFAGKLRIAIRLARSPQEKHAFALLEFLEHLEYIASQRIYFTDYAVVLFDDEFRRYASAEKTHLNDFQFRHAVAAHYFNSEFRRRQDPKLPISRSYYSQNSTGTSAGNDEPTFRIKTACRDYNRTTCTRNPCKYDHACGHCGTKGHKASACHERS